MTTLTREQHAAAAWVAGFVDGEGTVYSRNLRVNGHTIATRTITTGNTDPALIDHMAACLDLLGIRYIRWQRAMRPPRRPLFYGIAIRRADAMIRFREVVPIVAPEKRRRLDVALINVRPPVCVGCGRPHDERTPGCSTCYHRHFSRGWRPTRPEAVQENERRAARYRSRRRLMSTA